MQLTITGERDDGPDRQPPIIVHDFLYQQPQQVTPFLEVHLSQAFDQLGRQVQRALSIAGDLVQVG